MIATAEEIQEYPPISDAPKEPEELQQADSEDSTRDYGYDQEEATATKSDRGGGVVTQPRRRVNVTFEKGPHDITYRPGRVLLYSPPRQRQRWGDTQVLPRVNWGDLFFDLFYVSATYNVTYILTSDPNGEGLLYAAGTFIPLMGFWIQKLYYDARFVYEDDIYHRFFQSSYLVVVATAVLHIRGVKVLSHPSKYISMFVFCLMLVAERLMLIVQYLEVHLYGVGQRKVLQAVSLRDIRNVCVSLVFYVAALIVAAKEYFGGSDFAASVEDTDGHRNIAEKVSYDYVSKGEANRTPIILCLAGYLSYQCLLHFQVLFCFPVGGGHKAITVPLNVDFVLHRNGEWTMLMLGESIFNLLIVDAPNDGGNFFTVFYCGILSVILLQYLHFKSQPSHADKHAMRRSKEAGISYSTIFLVYSFALVTLGAAFTLFLITTADEASSRRLVEDPRALADDASSVTGAAEAAAAAVSLLNKNAGHLFSGSLAVIFFCLNIMSLLHVGLSEGKTRCASQCTLKSGLSRINVKGIVLLCFQGALLAFSATLSQWETDPHNLAILGLICVVVQLLFRRLGSKYLSRNQVHVTKNNSNNQSERENSSWPNVTRARAERNHEVLEK